MLGTCLFFARSGGLRRERKNRGVFGRPADLFEIPAGYTKKDMPFFDLGQMQNGRKSGARTPDLPFNFPKGLKIPFGQDE